MNAFACFGISPSPLVDQEKLKELFLEATAQHHPDVSRSEISDTFSISNQAYRCLQSDRLRLRHLLELCGVSELGSLTRVPAHLGDYFMKVGTLLQEAEQLLQRKKQAETLLEKAALQSSLHLKNEDLEQLLCELHELRAPLRISLEHLNQAWEQQLGQVEQLQNIYLEISYLDRWIEQVREKSFLLLE
jgi:hypothetical protein